MNPRNRSVEIKTSKHTTDVDMLQKAVGELAKKTDLSRFVL